MNYFCKFVAIEADKPFVLPDVLNTKKLFSYLKLRVNDIMNKNMRVFF